MTTAIVNDQVGRRGPVGVTTFSDVKIARGLRLAGTAFLLGAPMPVLASVGPVPVVWAFFVTAFVVSSAALLLMAGGGWALGSRGLRVVAVGLIILALAENIVFWGYAPRWSLYLLRQGGVVGPAMVVALPFMLLRVRAVATQWHRQEVARWVWPLGAGFLLMWVWTLLPVWTPVPVFKAYIGESLLGFLAAMMMFTLSRRRPT